MKPKMLSSIGVILIALLLFGLPGLAWAHGQTQVGDYALEIGFHNEPVYQGNPNSLDLFVTNSKTNEKVNGLESTLQVEIIFGSSKKSLTLSPQDGVDGGYTAPIIPTELGDYTWHIWGTIQGTPVDVRMTSSPTTFGSVEAKADYAFPAAEPALAEVQVQSVSASSTARLALMIGIVGSVLGAGGLLVGFGAVMASRRQTAK
jgi:hypothetical protein